MIHFCHFVSDQLYLKTGIPFKGFLKLFFSKKFIGLQLTFRVLHRFDFIFWLVWVFSNLLCDPESTFFTDGTTRNKITKTHGTSSLRKNLTCKVFTHIFHSTPCMEGTHCQLSAGFTDGLGCDNTDCLTNIHQMTGC